MKTDRRNNDIFSLSFLDIICCGFGAMVLLVLLSKTDLADGVIDTERIKNLLSSLATEQKIKTAGQQESARLLEQSRSMEAQLREIAANPGFAGLQQQLAEERAKAKTLRIKTRAPVPTTATSEGATEQIVKVGGIAVDGEYIIFIVDTSGSMQRIWSRVIRELDNVISIHPKVKGFQIMNDNGAYLIKAYAGKWIPDTPARRKSVLSAMKTWRDFSNSSPVEGLQRALKTYARRTDKLAIYIFGDDYSGASYDPVLDTISRLNRAPQTGDPVAQIHGVGFQHQTGVQAEVRREIARRFSTLMREVARQNRGAFVAIGG